MAGGIKMGNIRGYTSGINFKIWLNLKLWKLSSPTQKYNSVISILHLPRYDRKIKGVHALMLIYWMPDCSDSQWMNLHTLLISTTCSRTPLSFIDLSAIDFLLRLAKTSDISRRFLLRHPFPYRHGSFKKTRRQWTFCSLSIMQHNQFSFSRQG